jgi:hypothetical protein
MVFTHIRPVRVGDLYIGTRPKNLKLCLGPYILILSAKCFNVIG